ncbi:phage tail protein I [Stenotrophomonas pavanii]|uniref:Phage tail protein I n=1 Tax=Stenotrophomonas pavanii TaxID=487698 RepID=A0A246KVB2_9GAMM|nr:MULTISPECIES: phage tail protein I [Stenotrophomonas]MBC9080541.1 phage tail protein I [Stenotrophomonas maltophilia]MBC9092638.1 phage tail protein I [Stenotrophomonas maltophilia]MBH1388069.1 phage tail protein I [Stenotrophomonas maltophilia]MBH1521679.1 phage tail protein I [Stenotrophomonas maltophilia]MBH1626874.1 phage tail protein I [Stenotrophomonas maltophilia]
MSDATTRVISARLRGAIDGRNRTFRHPGGALATLQAVYRIDEQGRQRLPDAVISGATATLSAAPAPGMLIEGDARIVVRADHAVLPPNATHAERGLARAIVARPLPVDITALWDADRCPAALLPWLAWALSVDEWKAYWPETVKRARVRTAIAIQRRKGTWGSVRDVVAAFGGSILIREWWETQPQGAPHTFEAVMTIANQGGETATAKFVDDVIGEITRTKPVRSHFTFTQGMQSDATVGALASSHVTAFRRIQLIGE